MKNWTLIIHTQSFHIYQWAVRSIPEIFLAWIFQRRIFHSLLCRRIVDGVIENLMHCIKCPNEFQAVVSTKYETLAPISWTLSCRENTWCSAFFSVSRMFPLQCHSQTSLMHITEFKSGAFRYRISVSWTTIVVVGRKLRKAKLKRYEICWCELCEQVLLTGHFLR